MEGNPLGESRLGRFLLESFLLEEFRLGRIVMEGIFVEECLVRRRLGLTKR